MKNYIIPTTEVIPMSEEIMAEPGLSNGVGTGEYSNRNTFEEDISGDSPKQKSLWDD